VLHTLCAISIAPHTYRHRVCLAHQTLISTAIAPHTRKPLHVCTYIAPHTCTELQTSTSIAPHTYIQGPVYVLRARLSTLPLLPLHHIRARRSIVLCCCTTCCTVHALPATLHSTFVYLHRTRHIVYLPASRVAVCCRVLQCVAVCRSVAHHMSTCITT